MFRTVRRLLAGLVVASVSVLGVGDAAQAEPDSVVNFPEQNLKTCIESWLNLPEGAPITESQMASFTELRCNYKGITNIEPLKFATKLVGLDLDHNFITDLSPLENLSKLAELSLQENRVTDIGPLSGLFRLQNLALSNNSLVSLEPLSRLTALEDLTLFSTDTTNVAPLAGLVHLRVLHIGMNPIRDIGPLAGLDLKRLYMDRTPVQNLSALQEMKNLELLIAQDCEIEDVAPLSQLTKLYGFTLSGNKITNLSPLRALHEDYSFLDSQRLDARAVTVGQSVALPSIVTREGTNAVFTITSGTGSLSGSTVTWTALGGGVVSWANQDGTFTGEIPFTITAPVPPTITTAPGLSGALANGKVKTAYSAALKVTGTPVPKLEITKGALPNGLKLDAAGKITGTPLKAGTFTFTVTASNGTKPDAVSQFTITVTEAATDAKPCMEPRDVAVFADTPLGHKFYKEIDWMECMKYSTGWRQPVGKPLYKPADNLQRQAMAAFIYRMEAPKGYKAPAVSPFADVKPTDSFYKEMAWMYEMKYSTGWAEPSGKPTYRPLEPLSREAMAAFIYRLEASKDAKVKSYEAPKVSMLADMKPGAKFYKEISWMYDTKLSTGNKVGNTKEYWPKADLSRQAMAAFIYRLVTDYRVNK